VTARTVQFPFTTQQSCILVPPAAPVVHDAPPPLLVVIHGYAQTGARQQRWMGRAVPAHFAAAFPDGFLPFEVRRPERKPRIGYAWYTFTADRPAFLASLVESEAALWTLIDRAAEQLGADATRVWLAGFSQGAYLVNYAGMMRPDRVSGWISQCGNMREDYLQGAQPDLTGKPVLLQYGKHDEALPAGTADSCRDLIAAYGADITFSMHDAPHAITPGMADEANAFLGAMSPG
jgi:predicted esterase